MGQRYETAARRCNIALTFALQSDVPQILGDPLTVERVVAKLQHNALKFTSESGCVTLWTGTDNEAIVVPVEDTGPGIAAAALSGLFQKFRRATENGYHEGMGLDLFITKELVEAYGGQIDVKSTLGQGICFSVRLPLASVLPTVGEGRKPCAHADGHGSKKISAVKAEGRQSERGAVPRFYSHASEAG